jgi:hypothetical protein
MPKRTIKATPLVLWKNHINIILSPQYDKFCAWDIDMVRFSAGYIKFESLVKHFFLFLFLQGESVTFFAMRECHPPGVIFCVVNMF